MRGNYVDGGLLNCKGDHDSLIYSSITGVVIKYKLLLWFQLIFFNFYSCFIR